MHIISLETLLLNKLYQHFSQQTYYIQTTYISKISTTSHKCIISKQLPNFTIQFKIEWYEVTIAYTFCIHNFGVNTFHSHHKISSKIINISTNKTTLYELAHKWEHKMYKIRDVHFKMVVWWCVIRVALKFFRSTLNQF